MAQTIKSSPPQRPIQQNWKTPASKAKWLWLLIALLIYGGIYVWYLHALKVQQYPGPSSDPLRLFGIAAFCLVLITAAYSLRRRFVRVLPGRVQDWLWLHTWLGITSILLAFLHDNYSYILNSYCFRLSCFTGSAAGMSALYALLLLVASGIIGRLLDLWQARVIAKEASRNGVGITQALQDRQRELDLTIERLNAGKSAAFKQYSAQALDRGISALKQLPTLAANEQGDLQRLQEALSARARLLSSLRRQKRARFIIQGWRYIHIPLACAALAVIGFHGSAELLKMLLQLLRH